jgi:WD40 repeat protein
VPAVFTPDGRNLVGVTADARLQEVETVTGDVTTVAAEHSVRGVAVAPDGGSVYASSLDKTATRWGLGGTAGFGESFRVAPPGSGTMVISAARGTAVTLVGQYGSSAAAQLWDLGTGRRLGGPLQAGPSGAGWAAISPDAKLVAAPAYIDGHVTVWSTATGAVVERLRPPVDRNTAWIAFSPDSRLVATGTQRPLPGSIPVFRGGWTYIWDVRSGRLVASLHQPGDHGISTAIFSQDSRRIISVGDGGSVALWDVARRHLIRAWHTTDAYTVEGDVTADGRVVATGGAGGGLISLWDARRGGALKPAITSSGTVYPAGFFDGGRRLVVASNGAAQLWDVAGRRLMGSLTMGPGLPGATITPDGRMLVTTSSDGLLTTWPLAAGRWVADACRIANRQLTRSEWRTYLGGLAYRRVC